MIFGKHLFFCIILLLFGGFWNYLKFLRLLPSSLCIKKPWFNYFVVSSTLGTWLINPTMHIIMAELKRTFILPETSNNLSPSSLKKMLLVLFPPMQMAMEELHRTPKKGSFTQETAV